MTAIEDKSLILQTCEPRANGAAKIGDYPTLRRAKGGAASADLRLRLASCPWG